MCDTTCEISAVNECGGRLIELLEGQRDCYRRLKELAERQRRLITDQVPEALLKVLAERQRLVDQLSGLSTALEPFRQEWANTYGRMKADQRRQVQALLDEINTLLGAIMLTDAEDSRLLAASKEGVREQIQSAASGRMANTAYAAHAYQSTCVAAADHGA